MRKGEHLGRLAWGGFAVIYILITGCSSMGGGVSGNESGSNPINEVEVPQYQKAVNRCHKTGGTRIVKIDGKLRCF
ncbi:MAG: hypothetical protein R3B45_05555 [Bdellovibrionota bacterium]